MPNLPPLPLVGGALFIDNSIWMEGMSACYRYLQYKALNQRIPAKEKPSLNFGSAIHLALEHRYKNYQNKPVNDQYYQEVADMFTAFFAEHPTPDGDWRNLNWAMTVLRKYNERYETEGFNLLVKEDGSTLVELPFSLPLFTHHDLEIIDAETGKYVRAAVPVIYTGKIDLPISEGGNIYVLDHKTSSYLGDMFWNEMRMTAQQRGYVWAFQEITKQRVNGYIVNGIRTKEPPLYVTGEQKRSGKYTPESWWLESFQRERFPLSQAAIDEWKNNTIDLVEEFFWHYQRNYMPQKTKWCAFYGKCPYYEVCQLHPDDRQSLLMSGEFATNNWSPLKT